MSSYSFSQQFYQRWTYAPELIRAAIIQELTDITTLLQPETSFEDFVFDTHDLDAHLDELYENHHAEQAIAKAIADKQAADALRLKEQEEIEAKKAQEEEKALKAKEADNKRKRQEEADKQEARARESIVEDTIDNDTAGTDANIDVNTDISDADRKTNVSDGQNIATNDNSISAITQNARTHTAIHLSLNDSKLNADHESLIRELETSIDDYVSEQMMQISENLKSWMRAEVTQRLSSADQANTQNDGTIPDKAPLSDTDNKE
ncbi:hypothetical protein ACTXGO_03775 [Psychrobacter sp. T6-1]|uniref:hypothetical protein n=1 Tax=Psychrobacter sp. T6-1 TaxID=3457447 RepID=UPI003FD09133